jgi:hypothetical protein
MVLGGPRSATTWASNWLTTDTTHCIHDPLLLYTIPQLAQITIPDRKIGVSCTSLMLYPEFVNAQRCPKIILFRDIDEINTSLRRLGLVELGGMSHLARIDAVKGAHLFQYEQLFEPKTARKIAEILGVPWDPYRHDLLRQMRIEPMWRHLDMGTQAVHDLVAKLIESRG